jgi:hypothetical protein
VSASRDAVLPARPYTAWLGGPRKPLPEALEERTALSCRSAHEALEGLRRLDEARAAADLAGADSYPDGGLTVPGNSPREGIRIGSVGAPARRGRD